MDHPTVTKSYPFNPITLDIHEGLIEGFPAIFGNWDSDNETVEKGAFSKSIAERMTRIPMALDHETGLGVTEHLEEVGRGDLPNSVKAEYPDATGGLAARGRVVLMPANTEWLEREKARIAAGKPSGMSFSARVIQAQKARSPRGSTGLVLRELALDEWGPQARKVPINRGAVVTSVKGADPDAADTLDLDELMHLARRTAEIQAAIKAGRVLSKRNLDALEAAIKELQRIRAAASSGTDDEGDDGSAKSKAALALPRALALDLDLTRLKAQLLEV